MSQYTNPGPEFQGPTDLAKVERPSPAGISAIEREKLNMLVEVSHRYPRSLTTFKDVVRSMALLDDETAESCFYSLPRKDKDGKMVRIEGASIRFMEFARLGFGGLDCSTEIVGDDGRWVYARADVYDAQTNNRQSETVRRRITTKKGQRYSDDMIQVTGAAASSIALRNALKRIIPWAFLKPVLDECRKAAVGDVRTLSERRTKMIAAFGSMGITADRICAAIDRSNVDDITIDDLATLLGTYNAIRDGDVTADEAFPDPKAEPVDQPASVAPSTSSTANTADPDAAARRARIRDMKLRVPAKAYADVLSKHGFTPASVANAAGEKLDAILADLEAAVPQATGGAA